MGFLEYIKRDFQAVFERDPAARSKLEVLFTYPGFHAIVLHRISHALYKAGVPFIPRLLSHISRLLTGIEIHPAARIGPGFFIDHGMGVVIGETTEIGENCLLYQGVTLGGTGKEKGKRHPTLGNNVVVGAGAKVLGAIRIGDYVKIGANAVVLRSVPDYSIVVGVPGRVIKRKVFRVTDLGVEEALDHIHMPDPIEEKFRALEGHIAQLERKIEKLEGKGGKMKIYNTMSRKKEEFVPVEEGKVKIYACGVTVYDLCHIGHARSAVVFDVIRRYFLYRGYDVTYIRNFTDIDDKIIKRANEEGIPWHEVARKYTEEYYRDMDALGIGRADIEPKATQYINEMIDMIKGLIEKGYAYVVDGDVFFSVDRFKEYGKLSKRSMDELKAGARVEVDTRKRNPLDFALWKSSKEGEPSWESPWGPGRPGWHIECSVMSMKHLGETFDIHGGGADLIFPHHENEIAQSEAFTGKPFARYWVHNGFITIAKEKMSKSLGNFFTIRDILDKFDPEVVRIFLLSTHYRSPIEFSEEQLRETEAGVDRFYSTVMRVEGYLQRMSKKQREVPEQKRMEELIASFRKRFEEAMDDDFNTALAIGHIFEMIKEINRYLDSKPSGQKAEETINRAMDELREVCQVLNIFQRSPKQWHLSLLKTRKINITEEEINSLIAQRQEARKNKDWQKADAIRDE
ncbi:MAG: cysteine--tRNA ligase, partial [Nitrospirae bacterium]